MGITLRIRGIYATALTRFLIDNGFSIVCPSRAIMERFGKHEKFEFHEPVDVEIKDMEGGQGILLAGKPNRTGPVVALLRNTLFDAIFRKAGNDQWGATEIEFPFLAKSSLDEVRQRVIPTLWHHHRLRLIDSDYVDAVEMEDLAAHPEMRKTLSRNLEKGLIWDTYQEGKAIGIDHVKLNGQAIALSKGEIIATNPEEKRLTLKRIGFKGGTEYDGLSLPQKKGDYAITKAKEGDWFYSHTYYRRNGQLIGTYYNINTLVEFYPDKIRYVDLEIDVVKWPNGKAKIIDEEKLNRQFESGYLSEGLKAKAKKTALALKGGI